MDLSVIFLLLWSTVKILSPTSPSDVHPDWMRLYRPFFTAEEEQVESVSSIILLLWTLFIATALLDGAELSLTLLVPPVVFLLQQVKRSKGKKFPLANVGLDIILSCRKQHQQGLAGPSRLFTPALYQIMLCLDTLINVSNCSRQTLVSVHVWTTLK